MIFESNQLRQVHTTGRKTSSCWVSLRLLRLILTLGVYITFAHLLGPFSISIFCPIFFIPTRSIFVIVGFGGFFFPLFLSCEPQFCTLALSEILAASVLADRKKIPTMVDLVFRPISKGSYH